MIILIPKLIADFVWSSNINPKAKLKYPIGLLSLPELKLAGYGSSHYYNNGQEVWLAYPSDLYNNSTYVGLTGSGGFLVNFANDSNGVRPSVSLKPNTEFTDGDGSFTNPFVIGDAVEEPSGKSFDTVFAANNTDIFNENGLRYEGADPNNYICLDNNTTGSCSNKNLLFRIIGLFEEELTGSSIMNNSRSKLLKIISTTNYGTSRWAASTVSTNNYNLNNWKQSDIATTINNDYLGNLFNISEFHSKFANQHNGMAQAKWHLGGANSSTYNWEQVTAANMYAIERNTSAVYSSNPPYLFGYVGLMYPSDYGYATVGGTTTNKSSCREKELYNWDGSSFSDCKNNDWLFTSQSSFVKSGEWLLSPFSSISNSAAYLISSGYVRLGYSDYVAGSQLAVRPTFYLDSSILKIVGTGDGTKDNAYRIG